MPVSDKKIPENPELITDLYANPDIIRTEIDSLGGYKITPITPWGGAGLNFTFESDSGSTYQVDFYYGRGDSDPDSTTGDWPAFQIPFTLSPGYYRYWLTNSTHYTYTLTAIDTLTGLKFLYGQANTGEHHFCIDSLVVHEVGYTADTIIAYKSDLKSVTDYAPFGAPLEGRNWHASSSLNGFNGKRKESDMYGEGNAYDYGARMYNSRLGRWLAIDPLANKYPDLSPYHFGANNPIYYIDPDGKKIIVADKAQQAVVLEYLRDQLGGDFYKFNKHGKLVLDKKAYNAAKGKFNSEQTEIAKGLNKVIDSKRVLEVQIFSSGDIVVKSNPLVTVREEYTDDFGKKRIRTTYEPKYKTGKEAELRSDAAEITVTLPGEDKARVLINKSKAESEQFATDGGGKTNPSGSSVFIHAILDHGLDYINTGSLDEPKGSTPTNDVNYHNKALQNKGSAPRTGTDHSPEALKATP